MHLEVVGWVEVWVIFWTLHTRHCGKKCGWYSGHCLPRAGRTVEVWAAALANNLGTLYLSSPGASMTAEFWVQCSEMVDHLLESIGSWGEWMFGSNVQGPETNYLTTLWPGRIVGTQTQSTGMTLLSVRNQHITKVWAKWMGSGDLSVLRIGWTEQVWAQW